MSRGGIISSLALHIAIFLLAVFGLPSLFKKPLQEDMAISVEILPVSAISNVKPKTTPPPKPAIKKPEPPKVVKAQPQPKPEPKKVEPPKPKPMPVKEVLPSPPEPKPEIKKPEPKKVEPPKVEPKKVVQKKPEPEKPQPVVDDFAALEKNLEKIAQTKPEEKKEKPKEDNFDNLEKELSNAKSTKYNPNIPLSLSEMDAVRQQFYSCWTPPVGARDLEDMDATVHIQLQPDGTVTKAELVQTARFGSDSFYRVFAESAVRAVWKCNPLQRTPPTEKYDSWKDMELTFNPKNMF